MAEKSIIDRIEIIIYLTFSGNFSFKLVRGTASEEILKTNSDMLLLHTKFVVHKFIEKRFGNNNETTAG